MGIHYRIVARAAGAASALTGAAMLPALLVSLFFREFREAGGFALSCAVLLLPAAAVIWITRPRSIIKPEQKLRDSMLVVSVWWIVSSVLGGLPYLLCGVFDNPADAVFESASGFTTTGATVLFGLPDLPRGVLFWRAVTGWLGGIEILAVSLAVLPIAGVGYAAAQVESSAGLSERLPAREHGAARRLCVVYAGFTLLLFLFLSGVSIKPFDALIFAFGAISTSGFSNRDGGMDGIPGAAAFILCVFMLLAAVNFTLYHRIRARRLRSLLHNEELRAFLLILCGAVVLIVLGLLLAFPPGAAFKNVGNAFFEAASALTTTGFHGAAGFAWPSFCRIILLFLMLTGGCAVSTASGLKVGRVVILFRLLRRNISVRLHPNAVLPIKFDGKAVPTDMVNAIASYAMLYAAVFFLSTLLVSFDGGGDLVSSVASVLACMSNAGPGIEAAAPSFDAAAWLAHSPPIKLFLSLLMIAGRLEFATVLLLFAPRYWKND
jgi:trk system potassium uptake protein TrkH